MDEKNQKFGRGGAKFSVTKAERAMEFLIQLKDECVGAGFDARDKDVGAKSLEEDIISKKLYQQKNSRPSGRK